MSSVPIIMSVLHQNAWYTPYLQSLVLSGFSKEPLKISQVAELTYQAHADCLQEKHQLTVPEEPNA